MIGSFSDYLENKVLDHVLGKTAYTMPTTYIALLTATPTDASTGATIVEPSTSGTAYARKSTSGSDWNAASSGHSDNAVIISFTKATAQWGTITHVAIVDNATVGQGNVLAWGSVGNEKLIDTDDVATFAIGEIDLTLD